MLHAHQPPQRWPGPTCPQCGGREPGRQETDRQPEPPAAPWIQTPLLLGNINSFLPPCHIYINIYKNEKDKISLCFMAMFFYD